MKVKATYTFEFEPDTSDIINNKKDIAEDLTRYELDDMLSRRQITSEDFDFEVIDDHNDHNILSNIVDTLVKNSGNIKSESPKLEQMAFTALAISKVIKGRN